MNIYSIIFSFLAGIIGAMGLGGGSILIIYLSAIMFMEQTKAQGINVLFFIPCALYAVLYYTKERLIQWKSVIPMFLGAIVGVFASLEIIEKISTDILTKIFGAYLIILATKNFIKK